MHQFQTMEEEKFVASRKHTLQKTECLEPYWKKPRLTVSPFRNISMIPNTFTKFKREDFLRTPICSNVDWVKHKETYADVTAATCLLYRAHTATSYQS